MLYLYHGTTSVCAIKVRLTLAEKALPWEGEVLWLQRGDQYRPEYLKLNPNAVVPTLVHDDKVIIEFDADHGIPRRDLPENSFDAQRPLRALTGASVAQARR